MLQVNTIGKYTRFRVYSRKNTRLKKTNKQTNKRTKKKNTMTSKTLFPPGRKKSQQNIKQTPVIAITKY